jgi:hypothetical protein
MSVYRPMKRAPRNDVHRVADHAVARTSVEKGSVPSQPAPVWDDQRKASPVEMLLPATVRWIASLPLELRPTAIGKTFPRIANELATLWNRPDEFTAYLKELLVDRRGGRRGFPIAVARELHALRAYYITLHLGSSGVHGR